MKKYLLIAALFSSAVLNAQDIINNNGFETWGLDTFVLDSGAIGGLPADTVTFLDPAGWTSSNAISDLDSLGNLILVFPDSTPQSGSLAISMKTALITLSPSLTASLGQGIVHTITLPGFVLNGKFPIGPSTLLSGGLNTITPVDVKGSGQPFTQRLASLKGYINYTPVHNDSTGANDQCMIYATLRKGSEVIANAIFESSDTTAGWVPFSVNFTYVACDVPDTLAILMASSVPNLIGLANQGASGLQPGSLFSVDSLYYDTLPANYSFPVWTVNVLDTVVENSSNNSIKVTSGDNSCSGLPLSATIASGPWWGSATVVNDSTISYTPTAGYSGYDTVNLTVSNSTGSSSPELVVIYIPMTSAISDLNQISLAVYPVPASSVLNVSFENPGKTYAKIYDMLGNVVNSTTFTSDVNQLDLSRLAGGIYCMELVNTDNVVIARCKFNVVK